MVVRRLAGSIMWDQGAVMHGKRIPERTVEQTVDMPPPQIALQHAHFGREPFGKDCPNSVASSSSTGGASPICSGS